MREILFRGKRVDSEKWVEGYYVCNRFSIGFAKEPTICENHYIYKRIEGEKWFKTIQFEVIPETVSEFCGLLDKNGKKIFEGDIIQFGEDEEYDWEFNIGVVKFGEGTFDGGVYVYTGFFYEDKKGNIDHNTLYDWEEDWERCKVIGNIYDNPNLLNKELEE